MKRCEDVFSGCCIKGLIEAREVLGGKVYKGLDAYTFQINILDLSM